MRDSIAEIIPLYGDTKSRKKADEVFSRETFGSVLVGGHIMKVVEKLYNVAVIGVLLYILGYASVATSILIAGGLFMLWVATSAVVIWAFVVWHDLEVAAEEVLEEEK